MIRDKKERQLFFNSVLDKVKLNGTLQQDIAVLLGISKNYVPIF